jgi:uncharacterized C2H2 Zn-finger protein
LHLACLQTFQKSSKVTKNVALTMASPHHPKEGLYLLGGGRGWFPHKVKERDIWTWDVGRGTRDARMAGTWDVRRGTRAWLGRGTRDAGRAQGWDVGRETRDMGRAHGWDAGRGTRDMGRAHGWDEGRETRDTGRAHGWDMGRGARAGDGRQSLIRPLSRW